MLNQAKHLRQHVDTFLHELHRKELNRDKCAKLDALKLTDKEWEQVSLFCSLLSHANKAQQAFSSAQAPTLFDAIPAIKALYQAWSSCGSKTKYFSLKFAITASMEKVNEYYIKSADSKAHIMAIALHPGQKLSHFKKHWDQELQEEVVNLLQKLFKKAYQVLHQCQSTAEMMPPRKKNKVTGTLLCHNVSNSEDLDLEDDTPADPAKPWLSEFQQYLDTNDIVPDGMSIVK
ncbi:hypothetical protein C0991_009084, partial [Blastosporella zonata]